MGNSAEEILKGSRTVVIGHLSREDRSALPKLLKDQHVIDLVGIPELRDHSGISYQGLCW
jgi:hypothetical protein